MCVVAHRNPEDQASHDKAVEDIAASPRYHTKWGKVITNPGSVKKSNRERAISRYRCCLALCHR